MRITERSSARRGVRGLRRRVLVVTLVGVAALTMTLPASAQSSTTRTGAAPQSASVPLTPVLKCESHYAGWEFSVATKEWRRTYHLRYDLCLERQGNSLAGGVSINNYDRNYTGGVFGKMISRLMLCNDDETVIAEAVGQRPERSGQLPIRVWTKYVYGGHRYYRVQMEVIGSVLESNGNTNNFNEVNGRTTKFTSQCMYI